MPRRFQNVLQNFAAGALTPRLSARVDFEAYVNSLKQAKNFIISPQGGAQFREGFEYVGLPPNNQPYRIFQFHAGGDVSDVLVEVSVGLTRYWVEDDAGNLALHVDLNTLLTDEVDGAILVDEADGYQLAVGVQADPNPYTLDDLEGIYFTNQEIYGVLCHDLHPPQILTVSVDGAISTSTFQKERIPQYRYYDVKNPAFSATSTNWRIIFPADWEPIAGAASSFVYFLTYNDVPARSGGQILRTVFSVNPATNVTFIKTSLENAAAQQGYTITATPSAVDVLTYDVQIDGDNAGWMPKGFKWIYNTFGYTGVEPIAGNNPLTQSDADSDAIAEPAWSYPTMVTNTDFDTGQTHYYQCLVVHTAEAVNEPGADPGVATDWEQYWVDLGQAVPAGFDYTYPSGNAWTVDLVYAPAGRGFPTVAVFHDQRLLLMANHDNPTSLYGSGLGEYLNFVVGPEDDNPFVFVLDSSDSPVIKWARSQDNIILGTSAGDWNLKADVTLTPTDIHATQQNFSRSHRTMPIQVDNEIFYIELGQRKLRSVQYVREHNTHISVDASILAEHLISTERVKRVVCSYIPEVMMTILRLNGQPVYMTYDKSLGVMAYTECETDGTVNDIASFFSLFNNQDYNYYAIERNGQWVLERMRYPCGKFFSDLTAQNIVLLDSWQTGTVAGLTITGLGHLEGKEVSVLIDDAWQVGTYTVDQGGIMLNSDLSGSTYAVGLLYKGILETFEAMQNEGGTALGTKRRWNRLNTRLLNSALPRVYGQRAEDRTPSTPMNTAETIREGIQDVRQNVTGYGDGSILVEMDRPYPVQILGFFGEYEVEDR